jgi:alpha-amylase
LIYSNEVGNRAHALGFDGMLCDGVDRILGNRTPHQVYKHPQHDDMKLLLRNYFLSDDIAFRFRQGDSYLSVDRFMAALNSIPFYLPVINLGLDYETFGEHHKKESGVFKFLEGLLTSIATQNKFVLSKPSEVLARIAAVDVLDVPDYISWADEARDLSAWLGNAMQRDAFDTLLKLEKDIKAIEQPAMLKTWRHLLTSDHFYYMSTKKNSDGEVHAYFSHFSSPYEAFINYMNMLADFSQQVREAHADFIDAQANVKMMEAERKQHEAVPLWAENMATAYSQNHVSR